MPLIQLLQNISRMDLLKQTANWLWFLCYLLGVLFVGFGFAAAAILVLSRKAAAAVRLAMLVTVLGVVAAVFVGGSFAYNYHDSRQGVRIVVTTILLACATLALLLFGYFRMYRLFIK